MTKTPTRQQIYARLPADIGNRIRDRRTGAGLSQTGLAEILGISPSRVCNHEKGRHLPLLPMLGDYAAAFGTTIAELLEGIC